MRVSKKNILIEEKSKYTIEYLEQSKKIINSYGLKNALVVSKTLFLGKEELNLQKTIKLIVNLNQQKLPCAHQFILK